MTALLKLLYDLNHVIDMVSRLAYDIRADDIEILLIIEKGLCIEFSDIPDRAAALTGTLLHLVFTVITVTCEMADIRDVHHMGQAVSGLHKCPVKQVLEDEGSQVADMSKVVDRGTTAVEPGLSFFNRNEFFHSTAHGVIQSHCHLSFSLYT